MLSSSFRRGVAVTASLFLSVGLAFAADVNARIRGTVTDSTGAVVGQAQVIAINETTGVKYTTTSQSTGAYFFPQLPIGLYDVTVAASGFKTFVAKGISLSIDQEYNEPVKLELGGATEVETVVVDAVQVNTTDMQLNNVVGSAQMSELPNISRNFTGFELIEPGIQASNE